MSSHKHVPQNCGVSRQLNFSFILFILRWILSPCSFLSDMCKLTKNRWNSPTFVCFLTWGLYLARALLVINSLWLPVCRCEDFLSCVLHSGVSARVCECWILPLSQCPLSALWAALSSIPSLDGCTDRWNLLRELCGSALCPLPCSGMVIYGPRWWLLTPPPPIYFWKAAEILTIKSLPSF